MEEEKSERKRGRVNEWDRVLSISLGLIDQQLSRSVTSNLCARKLQYCTALVVNEISSLTEEEHQIRERVRRWVSKKKEKNDSMGGEEKKNQEIKQIERRDEWES